MQKGQRIKLILKNGFLYHGTILEISDTSVTIKDKFGDTIAILISEIAASQELHNGH